MTLELSIEYSVLTLPESACISPSESLTLLFFIIIFLFVVKVFFDMRKTVCDRNRFVSLADTIQTDSVGKIAALAFSRQVCSYSCPPH